jgi:ribosomal protein S27AE
VEHRLCKIFRTDKTMDAHLMQALLESAAIPSIFVEGNGVPLDESLPIDELGIRLFIPTGRRQEAENLIRERLGADVPAPYTGSLAGALGSRSASSKIVTDLAGEEQVVWETSDFNPFADSDTGVPPEERRCPECGAHAERDSLCCDQCGLTLPPLSV